MTTQPRAGLLLVAALVLTACSHKDKSSPPCADTCASTGFRCGEVCGISCGTCGTDPQGHAQSCVSGVCACIPQCDATHCGGDDGCGGSCPCAGDTSCVDCGLRLVRLNEVDSGNVIQQISIGVDWATAATATLPTTGDVRVKVDLPLTVSQVEVEQPLIDANKQLYRYVPTNLPWRQEADGSFRFLVKPTTGDLPIRPGRWLTITFSNPKGTAGPANFQIVPRAQVVAPPGANDELGTGYSNPLTVQPGGAP